jgi:hypothetical protein
MHFIFRVRVAGRRGRNTGDSMGWSTVREVAERCTGVLEREVTLSRRKSKGRGTEKLRLTHPPRKMRVAKLRFAATEIVIPRPQYLRDPVPPELTLNLVHVREVDVPDHEQPVEWLLYTTEPIDTAEQVAAIVDSYRARWAIEEFNAALKTGCGYEERQFESSHALHNMLAISLPVACDLLSLRSRARRDPTSPASEVLSSTQLKVLRAVASKTLSSRPTAEEALLAVAALGGHLKRNGPPGWKVLYRGMQKLEMFAAGWRARERAENRR